MMMANVEGAVKNKFRQKRVWVRRENGGNEQEEFLLIPVNLKGRLPMWKANDKLCVARCAGVGSDIGVGHGISLQPTCVVDQSSKYAHGNGDSVADERLEAQASVAGTVVKGAKNTGEARTEGEQIAASHIKDAQAKEALLDMKIEKLGLQAERLGFAFGEADDMDGAVTPPLAGVVFRKPVEPSVGDKARPARPSVSSTGSRRSRSSRRQPTIRPKASSPEKVRLNGSVAAEFSERSTVVASVGNKEAAEGGSEKTAQESSWQWHQNDWNTTQWEWQPREWEEPSHWHWNDWDDRNDSRSARGSDWASNHERYSRESSPQTCWPTRRDSCPSNMDGELAKKTVAGVELSVICGDVVVVSLEKGTIFYENASWLLQSVLGSDSKVDTLFEVCCGDREDPLLDRIRHECVKRSFFSRVNDVEIVRARDGTRGIAVGVDYKRAKLVALSIAVAVAGQHISKETWQEMGKIDLAKPFSELLSAAKNMVKYV